MYFPAIMLLPQHEPTGYGCSGVAFSAVEPYSIDEMFIDLRG